MNKEGVSWLRLFGILCHAWNIVFFMEFVDKVGRYVCSDENTLKAKIINVARIMVSTSSGEDMNEKLIVNIDDENLYINISEARHGLVRLVVNKNNKNRDVSSSDSPSMV